MKKSALYKSLCDYGLSEDQAKVYLASASLGRSTVAIIAAKAGIKRTTCYNVLDSLVQLGLVLLEHVGSKRYFVAQSPQHLEQLLDQKKSILANILPDLESLYRLQPEEETLKIIEGLSACKAVYKDILSKLRPNDEYRILSAGEAWYNLDPVFFEKFWKERAEKTRRLNVKIRLIMEDSKIAQAQKKAEKVYNINAKIFPKKLDLNVNVVILPEFLFIHQLKAPIRGFMISNLSIIKMQQGMFDLLWEYLL